MVLTNAQHIVHARFGIECFNTGHSQLLYCTSLKGKTYNINQIVTRRVASKNITAFSYSMESVLLPLTQGIT